MKHFCDDCGKSIKEVGRLRDVSINRKHYVRLCKNCYNKEKEKKLI